MKLTRRTVSHRRAWVSPLALLAFVLAQTLALVHGVVHVPSAPQQTASSLAAANHAHATADHLLGHAQGDQQGLNCQLFDQIAQAGGALADVVAFTPAELCAVPVAPVASREATQPLLAFHARGPPQA